MKCFFKVFKALVPLFLQAAISGLYSAEMMASADRSGGIGIDSAVYWLETKSDIGINASAPEEISALNLDSAVSTFTSVSRNNEKYELKEKSYLPSVKFIMRFGERFNPYVKLGIAKTELTGYGKKWKSDWNGIIAGLGLKYVLLQDTVVTPAFAVDLGITFKNTKIKKPDDVDTDLDYRTRELAVSFLTSKKLKKLEPYLGLQMSFVDGEFEESDIDADSLNVFYGCLYKFLPYVNLAVENSFTNMKNFNFSAGLKIGI